MENQIEIIDKEQEFTIEKRVDATMLKMPVIIKNTYLEILDFLKNKNSEPSQAPFVRYLNVNWKEAMEESKLKAFIKIFFRKWQMLIGFPVKEKIDGKGDLRSGFIQAGKYIKTIHKGPYQKVGSTYKRIVSYAGTKNLKLKNESIEIYTNDPRTTRKEDLETVVLVPVE